MTRKILPFFLSFFLLIASRVPAQQLDSLVRLDELVFHSDFEKDVFTKVWKDAAYSDVLSLLLASYPSATGQMKASAEEKLARTVSELKAKATNKSNTKNIKLIYGNVHDAYLRKYELENNFGDVFTSGNYNCLSASALYGLVLTRLDIPFSVKETPNHVYLVAYPAADKILIESTDPAGGYFQLNYEFMNAYLQNLLRAKFISKAEYESVAKADLFNKYYFSQEEDISLKKLAGLQYYNLGVYALSKNKHREAYQHFAKAQVLYPSTRINYLLQASLTQMTANCTYDKASDGHYLVMLSRFNTPEKELMERKALLGEFGRITEAQMINRSNPALYEQTFSLIRQGMKDTALLKEIEFVYNYETARISLNAGKPAGVPDKLDRAYQLQPQNVDVQSMITMYLFRYVIKSSGPQEMLATLDKNTKKYPFMAENQNVTTVIGNCYLDLAGQSFSRNHIAKGEEHLTAFEKLASDKEQNVEEHFVARAFAEAASAYFRAGNYAKSKQALNRGLKFAPDNFMLKERLSQMR
jgi:tetratricopeptide (TPR) repeat protein